MFDSLMFIKNKICTEISTCFAVKQIIKISFICKTKCTCDIFFFLNGLISLSCNLYCLKCSLNFPETLVVRWCFFVCLLVRYDEFFNSEKFNLRIYNVMCQNRSRVINSRSLSSFTGKLSSE